MSLKEPLIHYIGRELATTGLVKNEPWVIEHVNAAGAMYDDVKLKTAAGLIAAVHPSGIDYLRQCPAVAVATLHMTPGSQKRHLMSHARGRLWLAKVMALKLAERPKLKALLAEFEIAPALRKLKGASLSSDLWPVLALLGSHVPPSTLSQFIPDAGFEQARWLHLLQSWVAAFARHDVVDGDRHIEWAARNLRPEIDSRHTIAPRRVEHHAELVDYIVVPTNLFNPQWDWPRLSMVVRDWHQALADLGEEQRFVQTTGRAWDEPCDYAPLPNTIEVDGLSFHALRSAQDLWEEGRAMHHCVSSYTQSVLKGRCRIYGIRRGADRLATLEIANDGLGHWVEEQIKASYNRLPANTVLDAARAFLARINGVAA